MFNPRQGWGCPNCHDPKPGGGAGGAGTVFATTSITFQKHPQPNVEEKSCYLLCGFKSSGD